MVAGVAGAACVLVHGIGSTRAKRRRTVSSRRPKHREKDVEKVLRRAERGGWSVDHPVGHWGRLRCPGMGGDHCGKSVGGTPRNAGALAKQLSRFLRKCDHGHAC